MLTKGGTKHKYIIDEDWQQFEFLLAKAMFITLSNVRVSW